MPKTDELQSLLSREKDIVTRKTNCELQIKKYRKLKEEQLVHSCQQQKWMESVLEDFRQSRYQHELTFINEDLLKVNQRLVSTYDEEIEKLQNDLQKYNRQLKDIHKHRKDTKNQ